MLHTGFAPFRARSPAGSSGIQHLLSNVHTLVGVVLSPQFLPLTLSRLLALQSSADWPALRPAPPLCSHNAVCAPHSSYSDAVSYLHPPGQRAPPGMDVILVIPASGHPAPAWPSRILSELANAEWTDGWGNELMITAGAYSPN